MAWEFAFLDFIQENLRCGFLDFIVPKITFLGDNGYFWIALAIVMMIFPKTRKTGFIVALALVFDVIICNGIFKPLIGRIRPYDVNKSVELLIKAESDFSFPSGHTAASFAAVMALFLRKSKTKWPALVLAILIALTRLYLYVHYPTDILGGIVFGCIAGIIGYFTGEKLFSFMAKRKKCKH